MNALSDQEVEAYWTDGCLLPVRLFSAAEAAEVVAELAELENRYSGDPLLRQPYLNYCRENFHVVSTLAAKIAHTPKLLDVVEQLIGSDLLVWMVELIVKGPHSDKVITMHQDLTYWGLTEPDKLVSAWIALSDVTLANGSMRFVRGSHRQGQLDHEDTFDENNALTRGQRVMAEWDPKDEIADELKAGEMSLHHGLMFHGSGPNTTDNARVAIVVRFVSPEVAQTAPVKDHVMVVRGSNKSANLISIEPPDSDFSMASLDLYDEIAASQAQIFADGANADISYLR